MQGEGKLTTLLTQKPLEFKKIMEYARSKKFNVQELIAIRDTFLILKGKDEGCNSHLFLLACSLSKPEIVSALVKEGWNIHKYIEKKGTPLMMALEAGNIPVARLLIDLGVDFKSMSPCGYTPIVAALQGEQDEDRKCIQGVKLLLQAGVSINAVVVKEDQKKALHVAVCNNHPLVVDFLLKNGADGNALDMNEFTPLHIAVYNSYLNIIELLMKHKVELYIENNQGETPFLLAMSCSNKQAISTLVKGGYDVNKTINSEEFFFPAPLHLAVERSHLDIVKHLISLGADINKKAANGCTPLYFLCLNVVEDQLEANNYMHAKLSILNFLVENGADINVLDSNMFTPLQVSIQHGFLKLAKAFVRLGANLNLGNQPTPLYLVANLNRDIIVLFLEFGADFNVYSPTGLTPYHIALKENVNVKYVKTFVKFGCPYDQLVLPCHKLSKLFFSFVNFKCETQRFLLSEKQFFEGIKKNDLNLVQSAVKEGAVPTGCSEEIKYPLHFVTVKNYKDLVLFLLEHNSPPNAVNNKGETPLFIAAKQGHYDICCVLLKFGACYNYCSKLCPKTPLKIAEEFQHPSIVRLLQDVKKMFHLARFKPSKCVKELYKKLNNSLGNYLMSANAINPRGDTLLARTLRYKHSKFARKMMKLRTDNFQD